MTAIIDSLTPESRRLFLDLVKDSFEWSGVPLLDITREQRGNLTDLKRCGLIKTETDEGHTWCYFTTLGREAARLLGYELL